MTIRRARSRRNPLIVKRNWLQQRIRTLRNNCSFSFSDDVFITLIICLITGRRGTLLCTHEDNIPRLRQQLEQICAGLFERLVNSLDPASAFFQRPDTPGSSLRVRMNSSSELLSLIPQADPFAQAFGHQVSTTTNTAAAGHSTGHSGSSKRPGSPVSIHTLSQMPMGPLSSNSTPNRRAEKGQRQASGMSAANTANAATTILSGNGSPPDARPSIDSVWPNSIILTAEPDTIESPFPTTTARSVKSERLATAHRAGSVVIDHRRHLTPLWNQPSPEGMHRGSVSTRRTRRTMMHNDDQEIKHSHGYRGHSYRQKSVRESLMLAERGEDRHLTQVIILENVDTAEPAVIGVLMELLTLGRVRDRYGIHPVPTPFLLICISSRDRLASHPLPSFLLDQFLLSFTHDLSPTGTTPTASTTNLTMLKSPSMSSMLSMRQALVPYSEIRDLADHCINMSIGASVSRYIRDIVVAIRNHHAVEAGVTARSMLDLETVVRALATLYGRGFVTPELAMIATEKVFAHRLRLRNNTRYESIEEAIADVLRAIRPPV
ncbi:hypothetical protein BDF19DRAFT_454778 [Syncephalis fuscata]|nr:hypothetical protein BDF19DRAFT_454778 [Syncephalis fuscata]